jgi:hypothetical protein
VERTGAVVTEDELSSIAQQLVGRLREDDPEAVNRWLCSVLPSSVEWFRLCFVLAAAVPDDQTWATLTAWTTDVPMELRLLPRYRTAPHGTWTAAKRHRRHEEPLCEPCKVAERDRNNALYARRRREAAA